MKSKKTVAGGITIFICILTFVGFHELYLYDVNITNNYLASNTAVVPSGKQVVVVRIPPGAGESLHLGFEPAIITIIIGVNNTVTWINEDSTWHTTHSNIPEFYSNLIQPGSNFTHTFERAGVYPYHCDPHPWMTGKITVLAPQASSSFSLRLSIRQLSGSFDDALLVEASLPDYS
jgi:plastocyanin